MTAIWQLCNSKIPQTEIIYFTQVVLIYIVVLTCVINLSLGSGNQSLWSSLLSGSLGYLLPAPGIKKKDNIQISPASLDEIDSRRR